MLELTIRTADINDFENVMDFYHDLIDDMQDIEFRPKWKKDVYPTRQFIYDAIVKNELFVAIINNSIIASMVMNHVCADGYAEIQWKVSAKNNEIIIIHALAISLSCQKKGIAKKMMDYAINYCKDNGMKAIRLDVLASNIPAQKLYANMGFAYMGKIRLFYEDTGLTDFLLYELGNIIV